MYGMVTVVTCLSAVDCLNCQRTLAGDAHARPRGISEAKASYPNQFSVFFLAFSELTVKVGYYLGTAIQSRATVSCRDNSRHHLADRVFSGGHWSVDVADGPCANTITPLHSASLHPMSSEGVLDHVMNSDSSLPLQLGPPNLRHPYISFGPLGCSIIPLPLRPTCLSLPFDVQK